MKTFGSCLIIVSGILFYLIFYKFAPWLGAMVPAGEWHQLIVVGVYVIVGYFGGIGLPVALFFFGIAAIAKGLE